jgi:hypothetical protein
MTVPMRRVECRRIQTGLADRLDQQQRIGLRNHSGAATLDADTRVGPDRLVHLESASDGGGNKNLSNPDSRWSEALSAFLATCRTARLVKAARIIDPIGRQFFFSSSASITMMPLGPRTYVSL